MCGFSRVSVKSFYGLFVIKTTSTLSLQVID